MHNVLVDCTDLQTDLATDEGITILKRYIMKNYNIDASITVCNLNKYKQGYNKKSKQVKFRGRLIREYNYQHKHILISSFYAGLAFYSFIEHQEIKKI